MSRVNPGDEARLLSKLDELSDTDVTSLLESMLSQGEAAPPPAAPAPLEKQGPQDARARGAVGGADDPQLLSKLDQLSDEEVTNLLGEMLSEREPPRPAAAGEVGNGGRPAERAPDAGAVSQGLDQVSIEELTDEEVTSLLSRLLAGEEAG